MDVTCERCSTAYEFDDALVSERGTTVKCTNCGHQFRIRRPDGATGAPERWVVRTVDGRELEFTALRELQGAIAVSQITREDVLSRGSTRPRRLGSIAELDPFFAGAATAVITGGHTVQGVGPRPRVPTPQGLGAMPQRHEGSVAIPLPIAPRSEDNSGTPTLNPRRPNSFQRFDDDNAQTIARSAGGSRSTAGYEARPSRPVLDGLLDAREADARAAAPPPPPPPTVMPATAPPADARKSSRPPPPPKRVRGNENTIAVPVYETEAPAPQAAVSVRIADAPATEEEMRFTANYGTPRESRTSEREPRTGERESRTSDSRYSEVMHAGPSTPTPSNVRNTYTNEDYAEPRFSALPQRRGSAARWIVGFVISGVIVLFVVTIGRRVLVPTTDAGAAGQASADERVAHFLADGEKALADGDLQGAQEHLDKASALAEKDPKVAMAVARLAVTRADASWLKVKLLPADDADLAGAKKSLGEDAARAQRAVAHAGELTPNDAAITRARIDALRAAGDVDGARKLVPQISAITAQPESALTLAALDLGEAKVDWRSAIARLRTATASEGKAGRARSMLVYALAQSGDGAAAKTELGQLDDAHPLRQPLRAFLAKMAGTVDLAALPEVGKDVPADWHEALKLADAAKGKGERPRAEQLYAAAIEKSHGEPEALSGFANYKWETGDRPGALALYKQVIEKAPKSSPFAKHARQRMETKAERREEPEPQTRHERAPEPEHEAPAPAPAPGGSVDTSDLPGVKAPPAAPPQAAPPSAPPPQDAPPKPATPPPAPAAPPGVDTSDLPGFK